MSPSPSPKPDTTTTKLPQPHGPCCFDSHPTDLVLIEEHLRPWLASGLAAPPAAPFLHVADMYAAGPTELSRTFAPAVARNGERAWYFLTRLRGKGPRRFTRTVDTGAGWWHGEARERPVVDGLAAGRQAGRRQFFSFMTAVRGGGRARTGWIMAELRLGSGDGGVEEEVNVLCKVYRSPRHPDDEPATLAHGLEREEVAAADDDAPLANSDDGDVTALPPGCDEGSAKMSIAAPAREPKNAADEQSSVATRKRSPDGGDEQQSLDASRKTRKQTDDGGGTETTTSSPAPPTCCPRCGFLITFFEEPEAEDAAVLVEGDSTMRAHKLYNFF